MLANKNNTRRTSDFQGIRRAMPKGGGVDKKLLGGRPFKSKLSIKAPTNSNDISAVLKALRSRPQ